MFPKCLVASGSKLWCTHRTEYPAQQLRQGGSPDVVLWFCSCPPPHPIQNKTKIPPPRFLRLKKWVANFIVKFTMNFKDVVLLWGVCFPCMCVFMPLELWWAGAGSFHHASCLGTWWPCACQTEVLTYLKMTLIPVTITVLMQRNPISIRVKIQGDLYQCCYLGGAEKI